MSRFLLRHGNNGKLKAAQIVGNAQIGGVVSSILNYYRHADKSRWQFDFFTYGPSPLDSELKKIDPDARVFTIPRLDTQFYKAVPKLKQLLAEGGYAVAHSHMTTLSTFALKAAKQAGVPVRICHSHSTFDSHSDHYLIKKTLRPFAAKNATHLVACGKLAAENLYKNHADEAIILRNAIDLEQFSPLQEEEREQLRSDLHLHGKVLLFVGRFVYQKNLFFLLNAFAYARRTEPLTLVLVGDGADKDALMQRAKELGIADSVRFIPPTDPIPYYRAADIFVLPSRYEGMPVVAAEAQSIGLHCLFSDAVSREADLCGCTEFLPLCERLWANKFTQIYRRKTNCTEKLQKNGYDIRQEASKLITFYDTALKETPLPPFAD